MKSIFTPTHSRPQRWLISCFLLLMLGALAPMLWRSFVPDPNWQRTALALAVALSAAIGLLLRRWWRLGLWRPGGPWLHYSVLKRCLMAPLCAAFIVFVLWLNLAMSLPMAYTSLLGQEAQQATTAHKHRGSGRRSCDYQLRLADIDYWLFEFCLEQNDFDALPDGPLPMRLRGNRSALGTWVNTLQLQPPEYAEHSKLPHTSPH